MNLKGIREELNISQKDLSLKLNVSPTNIYNYENGRTEPSIDMLIKIADALNVSVDYLIGRTDEFGIIKQEKTTGKDYEAELLFHFRKLDAINQNKVIGFAYALTKTENSL